MKLVSIEIDGFRRFDVRQNLHVDCRVVALLGPNEAGKTSILRALLALNDRKALASTGPSQDLTRGRTISPDHVVLTARFRLEDDDYATVSDVPEVAGARWLLVRKLAKGELQYSFWPEIRRSIEHRIDAFERIDEILRRLELQSERQPSDNNVVAASEPSANNWLAQISSAVGDLDAETIPDGNLSALLKIEDELRKTQDDKCIEIAKEISSLMAAERRPPPARAATRLQNRVPRFVLFSEQDRDLRSVHDLNSFFGQVQQKTAVPQALQNLATTAELSLQDLFVASQAKDEGAVETLLDRANDILEEKLRSAWTQSKIQVRFRLSGNILSILVQSGSSGFDSISERSDGLKQFVALFAFLTREISNKREIVLLIDEAEIHLHYDAQADLVQMLARQDLARKVIYSTHSVACLPEDLGLGIRFVQPKTENTSEINNRFWSKGGSGLSPVLFGMGAATMAFLPVRFCVLTEGPTDMILLPILLRQANNVATLGFQISPGLAQANETNIALMQHDGSRVLFLVDGDVGGKDLESKLKRAKIAESKILRLDQFLGSACVIEDFIEKKVYVAAVNEELRRSGFDQSCTDADIPGALRPTALGDWCKSNAIPVPNKVNVAYQVLDQSDETDVVEKSKISALQALYGKIREVLAS